MINKILSFRNIDSTADINSRLAGLVPKGIVSGGVVRPEPNTLQVRVTGDGHNPWSFLAYSNEGMVVRAVEDIVLPVIAGTTNVIALRARYVENGEAIGEMLSMTLGAYETDADQRSLIRLCSVTPTTGATTVQPAEIDNTFRDSIESFRRNSLRGVVETVADLPASSGFPATAEINFLSNDFAEDTTITLSTGAATVEFPIVPPLSFNLAAPTSDPITAGLSRVNSSERTVVSAIETALTGLVTVTTSTPHGMSSGTQVRITGNSAVSLNGVWTITVASSTTFTYFKSGSLSPATGTGGVVINTATTCTVTAHLAPGVLHNLLAAQVIAIEDAIDPSFNVASSVQSVIDAQTFTFNMSGYQSSNSGGGRVIRVGVSLPPNGVQIGTTATQTANEFERVFNASLLAPAIRAIGIGSSIDLQATANTAAGNAYTLAKDEPGVLPVDEVIVLSGPTFEGGVDPILTEDATEVQDGDLYVVLHGESGTLEIWGFDGVVFRNLTSSSVASLLDFHRRNLLENEKHLSENQAAALEGSAGVPGPTNRFVTEQDASVLTADLGDALQGADNVAPSNDNRFLTEARYRGERAAAEVNPGDDFVYLAPPERWVVGNDAGVSNIRQYFNLVFTSTLNAPGGPSEYTQQDFTPLTVIGFFTENTLTTPLDPSDLVVGADDHGIYPRVEAASLSYPTELYVQLSAVPDNGDCTLIYSKAEKEKYRKATADMLAGPQRILPAEIASINNKVSELRFNSGIDVSGTTISFPANLFVAPNLQSFVLRRFLGGRGVTLEDTFEIDLEAGTGTLGIVESFTPIVFSGANIWTRYLITLTVEGTVKVYPLEDYVQYASDTIYGALASDLAVASNAFTQGEWLFASVAVKSSGVNTLNDLVQSSVELYPYQADRGPYAAILVGDSQTSFGHYSGPDAITRALKVARPGSTLRILPGNYLGQALVSTDDVTLEWCESAVLSHQTLSRTTAAFNWNTGSDIIADTGHGFLHNQVVRFTTTGTAPTLSPSGSITTTDTYYIQYVNANSYQLATTMNGAALNLSTQGTGSHTLSTYVRAVPFASWTVAPTSQIAYTAHGFYDDLAVKVASPGTPPTGILSTETYYIEVVDANTFRLLDAPGGAVVAFTTQGTGTHTVSAEQVGLIVDAADLTLRNAHIDNLDIGVRLTGNASGYKADGVTFGSSIVIKNYDSATAVTKTQIVSNPYAITCTDGLSDRYFGDYNAADAIQQAIDAATDWESIIVYPGTYTKIDITGKNGLQILGQPGVYIDGNGSDPCITVSGDGNLFEHLVCTNAPVGIECATGAENNIFSSTVSFSDTIKTRIKFPDTSGVKHGNYHALVSGRGSHLVGVNDTGQKYVTVGDGVSSWGDYNGASALEQALTNEAEGTTIRVGNGTYAAVIGVAFDHMTVEGTGEQCIIEADQATDLMCLEVAGSHNKVSGFHFRVSRPAPPYDYSIIGIKVGGNGNIFDRITYDESGLTLIAHQVRYVAASGAKNSMRSRTGAATGEVTYTVGDGVRSFGDYIGTGANGIPTALSNLPVLPGGTLGAMLAAGPSANFQDQSLLPIDFTSPTPTYYLGRYVTLALGANAGTWKITAVVNATTVTLTRDDGGAFVVAGGLTWSLAVGTRIVVLPGTYEPFTIPATVTDLSLEAWSAGADVLVSGGSPLITAAGSRCRISGFRLEDTGTGFSVSGKDNTFERNRFSSSLTSRYALTGTGNKIYDAPENSDKHAYTVSASPSRADFVGTSEAAIQAAVDAAAADPHIKNVYIGAGTYTFTTTVTVPQGITIIGSGYGTQLVGDGLFPAFTLTTGNQTISGIRFNTFSFSLTGPATDVFAYGNWLAAAPISGTVTGSVSDNL